MSEDYLSKILSIDYKDIEKTHFSDVNGEKYFFDAIKDKINILFDVGCRMESEFINFTGEVHYFDPVPYYIDKLKLQEIKNSKSYFNDFGLGSKNDTIYYYPSHESFYDRKVSLTTDEHNKFLLDIKKSSDYIISNDINCIDFLKIDTEGYEFEVLKGFEEHLEKVKLIQFEYGGTYLDSGVKLLDVISYLKSKNFSKFHYLTQYGMIPITDFTDHYMYSNIICQHNSQNFY